MESARGGPVAVPSSFLGSASLRTKKDACPAALTWSASLGAWRKVKPPEAQVHFEILTISLQNIGTFIDCSIVPSVRR
jgi:hypothetical protein